MSAFNKFHPFVEKIATGLLDLNTDVLKVLLTNVAPVSANSVKADLTEISAGNGYTAGGNAATFVSGNQVSGVYKLVLADPTEWVASGGTIGPFRYAVLYDDTVAGDPLIGWWDYGSSITLQIGETFTIDLNAATGVLTLT